MAARKVYPCQAGMECIWSVTAGPNKITCGLGPGCAYKRLIYYSLRGSNGMPDGIEKPQIDYSRKEDTYEQEAETGSAAIR